ncbi:MAG: hypothetical protein FWH08_05055 [Oscillospiraceae bacterium]|nr:hypothetical protein [Oscillospiraceae bacterium]
MNWHNVFPEVPEEFHKRVLNTLETPKSNKNEKGKAITMKRKVLRFAAVTAGALIALTITAGAVSGWNYSELINNLFGNNQNLLENMQGEINYEVVTNTFEGVDFEISALYADSESIFLAIDVLSEESLFGNNYAGYGVAMDMSGAIFYDEPLGGSEALMNGEAVWNSLLRNVYVVDENIITILEFSTNTEGISAGEQYTVFINGITAIGYLNEDDEYDYDTINGQAEIKFIIGKTVNDNLIVLYPEIMLESGSVLEKLIVNPFAVCFYFTGLEDNVFTFEQNSIYIKTKDGEMINMGDIMQGGMYADSYVIMKTKYQNTLDLENIETVIYQGIEIPIN